ncbi:unnamed protein product [Oikopleura dioica]|uniref:Tuberin N-terminal domain-containing protein n=1 Tax=Oikopleura dioica TaxID=34765 RepID=E4YBD1_OIKDI|nr:unnamed protein product [Oikopleura dioica]
MSTLLVLNLQSALLWCLLQLVLLPGGVNNISFLRNNFGQQITHLAPSDGFDVESADLPVRPRIVEAILDRTFHKAKGKQKGTGIWLAALCDAGRTNELSEELNRQLFCGLLNRLLLSSEESTYCAKGLRKFHEISSDDQRKVFSNILNLVIAHGKVPEKDGKLAERKIPLEDAMGLKDLLKIILELKITRHVFDLLSLGLTGDLTAVKNIDEESIKLLTPDLLLMVNHKNESIRSIGKNIFQAFEVSKRIDSLLKNCLDKCLERIQGFDGDYREAANRTLPVLLQHLSADVNVLPPERFIDLWNCVLRCCDDTRDNVKAVATTSCLELMKFTIRVVNEANVIPNWIKPMLDIIVDEYLDSATSTNVLIGMSLVSRWAESKRGLPLYNMLHTGCELSQSYFVRCFSGLSIITDIDLQFYRSLFTGAP